MLAGLAVWLGLGAIAPPAPSTYAVVTVTADLPVGHVLTPTDLSVIRARDHPPPTAIDDPAEATGRSLATPIVAGEALTRSRLAGPGLLAGMRDRVAVAVTMPVTVAAALRPGDRVDLYGGGVRMATRSAVLQVTPREAAAGLAAAADPGDGVEALVAVSESEARALSTRDTQTAMGASLSVVVLAR